MAVSSAAWTLLLSAQLLMVALAAETTNDADAEADAELTVSHVASTMTSITVSWSPESDKSAIYHVEAVSQDTGVRLIGPELTVNETEYTLPDLAVDALYELCVNSTSGKSTCVMLSTIPVVRDDSLIALFIALAVLASVIIIAVVLWRCAIRQAGGDEEETPSDEKPENEDDEKQGANEKAPLLTPAEPDQAGHPAPTTDPQSDTSNQEQPQSLYLFLAEHAFK